MASLAAFTTTLIPPATQKIVKPEGTTSQPSGQSSPSNIGSETKSKEHQRLPAAQKTHFGLGFVSNNMMVIGLEHMLFPVFSLYLGLSPAFIGYAVIFPTAWHSLVDAFVGHFSDNLRTRWGRRRPLIVIGALMSALIFGLIWSVPEGFSENARGAWLIGSLTLFWTAHAFFFVPLDALGLSLAPNYNERTSLMAYRSFFAKIGQLASGWCFWLVETGYFGEGHTGAISVGWIWAGAVLVFGAWPGFFLRERTVTVSVNKERLKWWTSIKIAMRSKAFRRITGYLFFASASLSATNAIHFYTNLHWVANSDTELASKLFGAGMSLNIISGMAALPLVSWSSKKIGKHYTAQIAVMMTGVGALLSWVLMTPAYPWLSLGITPFIGMGIVAVYQLYFAMLADAAEEAALTSGKRNEGTYSAISSSLVKLGQTLSLAFSGLLLGVLGIEGKDFIPDGEQLYWLRILRAFVPGILTTIALVCLINYPLTAKRLQELEDASDKD